MNANSVAIATATLLAQLLAKLEERRVLEDSAVDDVLNQALALQSSVNTAANSEAAYFIREVRDAVHAYRQSRFSIAKSAVPDASPAMPRPQACAVRSK